MGQKPQTQFNRYANAISKLCLSCDGLDLQLINIAKKLRSSRELLNEHNRVIWETSVNVIGPISLFYTWWLLKSAQKHGIKKLYFLARDSEIFFKISNLITAKHNFNIQCEYLYGSRHLWLLGSLQRIGQEEIKWIFSDWWYPLTISSLFHRLNVEPCNIMGLLNIWGFPSSIWDKKLSISQIKELKKYFQTQDFSQYLLKNLEPLYQNTLQYLIQSGLDNSGQWAITDIGWRGNPQVYLSKILKKGGVIATNTVLKGFYLGLTERNLKNSQDNEFHSYLFDLAKSFKNFELRNNHLLECFTANEEGKTIDFKIQNGRYSPVYSSQNTQAISWGITLQKEGILSFTREFIETHNLDTLNNEKSLAILAKLLHLFIINPTYPEASVYGSFPMDGELTEKNIQQIAPQVTSLQLWKNCLNLKQFNLFWIQASIKRSNLRFEGLLWRIFFPIIQIAFYSIAILTTKIKSWINYKN